MDRWIGLAWLPLAAALLAVGCSRQLPAASEPGPADPGGAAATPRATSAPWADPPSPTPSPAPFPPPAAPRTYEPVPADLPAEIVAAIEWRREAGLRDDPAWVIEVARDPATSQSWEHPITAEEEAFLWERQERLIGYVAGIQAYAAQRG